MEDPPPPKIYFHAANSQSFTDASSTGLGRWAQGEFAAIPTGERASLIKQALKLTGVPDTVENEKAINIIALGESSWSNNPPDCHDSNWRAGHPSKGLMQMIPETFNSHKLAGHDDILNPLDNMCAAINYATSRYGGLTQVPGVIAVCNGQHYRGY
jgi:SLT domain-containing protein